MMGNCCNREVLSGVDSCFQNVCYEKQVCTIQNTATHNQGWICVGLRAYEDSMPVVLKCKIT